MSISLKPILKLLTAGAVVASLTACGNDGQARRGTETVKGLVALAASRLSGKKPAPTAAPDPVAMISSVLAAVPDAPLQFVLMERSGQFAVSSIYGVNGQNVTWVSPDLKSMTLRSGMLTATRGFGGDLMSVEDGGAARLIAEVKPGFVTKTYRFLNGLDETTRLVVDCRISVGGTDQVESGEISTAARVVTERCTSGSTFDVSNTYWIDSQGRMVQSMQWAGASTGNIVFRRLRF